MSAIDDLTTVPDQPQISEGNKTFSQKTFALWLWIRTKLVPAMVELRDLIVNSVTGAFSGTSTSTVTIVDTGEVTITTDAGRSFKPGTPVRLAYVTDPLKYIDGITKTYNASTGALVFYALSKAGSGEYSNWSLTIIPSGGGLAGLGSNTFVGAQYVPDDPYDATSWNGSAAVPTKNAIRNALVALIATIKNLTNDSTLSGNSSGDIASTEWSKGISLGWGQTVQDVTVSRSPNTIYTNGNKPIFVNAITATTSSSAGGLINGFADLEVIGQHKYYGSKPPGGGAGYYLSVFAIVPANAQYRLVGSNFTILNFTEMKV